MILEHALLTVGPERSAAFEEAFTRARPLIAGMPGFRRLTLSRCLERDDAYLLLVGWDRLEDHTSGFRGSPEYREWRTILHPFYDPFPTVEHFAPVLEAGPPWKDGAPGVVRLPSGRLVRGRALRRPVPDGPQPDFAVQLLGEQPPWTPWRSVWVRWPDFRLPADPGAAREALAEAWRRADTERVEVACGGGRGRTGTALACLAVLDGVPAGDAVAWAREHYDRRAVETPRQARFVRGFA
jgi:heme-degrading monooxygenase HmoA